MLRPGQTVRLYRGAILRAVEEGFTPSANNLAVIRAISMKGYHMALFPYDEDEEGKFIVQFRDIDIFGE